jgi:hypothetical protein
MAVCRSSIIAQYPAAKACKFNQKFAEALAPDGVGTVCITFMW